MIARKLRNDMTEAERFLWSEINRKKLKAHFYRQKIIGNYIVDFYCPKANLIIELDGEHHSYEEKWNKDLKREEYLKNLGLKIIRFNNKNIFRDIDKIVERIWIEIGGDVFEKFP